jgi:hypothetical protein
MKVTIKVFQALNEIADSPLTEFEKSVEFVKVLTGKSEFEIDKMSVRKFNKICNFINEKMNKWGSQQESGKPKSVIYVSGKPYKIMYDIFTANAGKYVEIMEFSKEPIKNLHKILASMVTPLKLTWRGLKEIEYKADDHERISNEMLNANYDDVYQAFVFFYAVSKKSMENLATYGKTAEERTAVQLLLHSLKFGDGFTKPNWYRNLMESN